MYDVIVIGAGPAGMTAGIYAAKNKLKTFVVAKELSIPSNGDDVFVGGEDVAREFKKQLTENAQYLELQEKTEIIGLEKNVVSFSVEDQAGQMHYGRAVIVATGTQDGEGRTGFYGLTAKDQKNRIKVNSGLETGMPGVLAAGSVISGSNVTTFVASAQGAQAALGIARHLKPPS